MPLQLIITNAGLSAIAQAGTLGPVVISKVAIGSGTWATNPPTSTTALKTQIKQITPQGSSTPAPGIIHITAEDSTTDAYSVSEIGLYDANNVLFAIAGSSSIYLSKYSASTALLSVDISLANVPVGTVTIGNANFTNPPATESTMGVAEIATSAEVTAGTDDTRIVTPAKLMLAGFVKKTGDTMTGDLNLAGVSNTVNGYSKLPNGFILQWGRITGGDGGYNVVFPVAFPNACYSVVASTSGSSGGPTQYRVYVQSLTTTGFYYFTGGGGSFGSTWMAIGY